MQIETADGLEIARSSDIDTDAADPALVAERLRGKFLNLVGAAIGDHTANGVLAVIESLGDRPTSDLMAALSARGEPAANENCRSV